MDADGMVCPIRRRDDDPAQARAARERGRNGERLALTRGWR